MLLLAARPESDGAPREEFDLAMISELLADLRQRDIRIPGWKGSCAPPALDAETKKRLVAERRQEIIDALRQADRPVGIVPLKLTGSRPPIFAIPKHNGDVFGFHRWPVARGTSTADGRAATGRR